MVSFREQFELELTAARKLRAIGILEYMRGKRALRRWDSPTPDDPSMTVGDAIREFVLDHAIKAGVVSSAQAASPEAINWEAIADFIAKVLPMILDALALFCGGL